MKKVLAMLAVAGALLVSAPQASANPQICATGPFGYVLVCAQGPGWVDWNPWNNGNWNGNWNDGPGHGHGNGNGHWK